MASEDNPGDLGTIDSARHDDRGASLVEYALLLALIAVVCIGTMAYFGTSMSDSYDENTRSMFLDS